MKIKTVTITGADNNTNLEDLVTITDKYPFVEWGILFSPKRQGTERYPDFDWLEKLKAEWKEQRINLSAHLCGQYTREMLAGKSGLIDNAPFVNYMEMFKRFQLNFNASKNDVDIDAFFALLRKLNLNFILQQNYSNYRICQEATFHNNISFLYDSSGGRGNSPESWQPPIKDVQNRQEFFTGYSGGLSPDNLEEQLKKIESVTGDSEIWIDTETNVRTNEILDMDKVVRFLRIAEKYTY